MDDDHMNVWQSENFESSQDQAWYAWIAELEVLTGHNLDGSLVEDGYSMDYVYDQWELGWTPARAAAKIESNKRKLREAQ